MVSPFIFWKTKRTSSLEIVVISLPQSPCFLCCFCCFVVVTVVAVAVVAAVAAVVAVVAVVVDVVAVVVDVAGVAVTGVVDVVDVVDVGTHFVLYSDHCHFLGRCFYADGDHHLDLHGAASWW